MSFTFTNNTVNDYYTQKMMTIEYGYGYGYLPMHEISKKGIILK